MEVKKDKIATSLSRNALWYKEEPATVFKLCFLYIFLFSLTLGDPGKYIREHIQGAIFDTCDLWDIWSEWWENMTWQIKDKHKDKDKDI